MTDVTGMGTRYEYGASGRLERLRDGEDLREILLHGGGALLYDRTGQGQGPVRAGKGKE